MSKRLEQYRQLVRLARLREMAAQGEFAQATHRLRTLDEKNSEIRAKSFPAETLLTASVLEKWQQWRVEELGRLTVQQAKLAAVQRLVAAKCGRLTAEKKVVESLLQEALRAQSEEADRRRSYIS